ncbi:hypothetical protein ACWDRB_27855, partial [Nonomuraea sp. NPDC003707]
MVVVPGVVLGVRDLCVVVGGATASRTSGGLRAVAEHLGDDRCGDLAQEPAQGGISSGAAGKAELPEWSIVSDLNRQGDRTTCGAGTGEPAAATKPLKLVRATLTPLARARCRPRPERTQEARRMSAAASGRRQPGIRAVGDRRDIERTPHKEHTMQKFDTPAPIAAVLHIPAGRV